MQIIEIKPHYYQKQILKKLLYSIKGLHFNELLLEGLESEHMNYHLQKLIDFGLVEKLGTNYGLTHKGKDYVNLLDDKADVVEKQPKVSVLARVSRFSEEKQENEYLVYKKLRQPYFGKVGTIGGKVRFGETMEEAVKRELYEETGLTTSKITLLNIYRKMRTDENNISVQDVIFFTFLCEGISGQLIEKSEVQENFWATEAELLKRDDLFDDFKVPKAQESLKYVESQGIAVGF